MYAVLNFGWKPSEFHHLPTKEKAFVMACIDERIEAEKEAERQIKR